MRRIPAFLIMLLLARSATGQERASIAEVVHRAIEEAGVEQAVATYHDLRRTAPDAYDFGPSELNALGYRLLNEGRTDAAVRILGLNIEVYPRVANGYDGLAHDPPTRFQEAPGRLGIAQRLRPPPRKRRRRPKAA